MKVGCPREIKIRENRVGLTPAGAAELVKNGHTVLIEKDAGLNSGFPDTEYLQTGAQIVDQKGAWSADLVVKVKEPLEAEYPFLRDQIVFTYFHLAGVTKTLTEALVEKKTTAIAYETLEDENGKLPLLAPMSAVAGNMATMMGSYYLAKFNQGKGMQLGTVLGQQFGKAVIIGDGVVGRHAAKTAYGIGASVVIFGRREEREGSLKQEIGQGLTWMRSTPENIAEQVKDADVVVGGVLIHGAKAPYVVTEEMVRSMQPGSVIVDVSIDQGGCIETSKPTTHEDPVYRVHEVIHYCVTNMPGAYPRTSTIALTTRTLPYVLKLAEKGLDAVKESPGFVKGVNTYQGFITYKAVAENLSMPQAYKAFE